MTLHEAIVQVLKSANRAMTTQQIAEELNKTKAYQKRDGSAITDFQIHGRTKNYPHLFNRDKSLVSLKGGMKINLPKLAEKKVEEAREATSLNTDFNFEELEESLLKKSSFTSAKAIDAKVPLKPGIYCFKIKNIVALPKPFNTELLKWGSNIIYIGIATKSLNKRMLNQELRANGHGTFFRSIGAVLGYKPPFNSLMNKKNKRNYKFSVADETKIVNWLSENLLVNWVEQSVGLEKIETALLRKYKPLLNLAKNPLAMPELSALRKDCVEVANGR